MAISAPHFYCFRELHRRGELPQGGALLEIGEANWYGDLCASVIDAEVKALPESDRKTKSLANLARIRTMPAENDRFEAVKILYSALLTPKSMDAVDYHGPTAWKYDLNKRCPLPYLGYDIVINHGTCEHIFNIGRIFETIHDSCKVDGLMIHESPFTGWIDHGFWTIQPTAYFDLSHANNYKMVFMAVNQIEQQSSVEIHSREHLLKMAAAGGIPNNSMLYVAMRKTADAEFKIPMQGVYAGSVSEGVTQAWRELR